MVAVLLDGDLVVVVNLDGDGGVVDLRARTKAVGGQVHVAVKVDDHDHDHDHVNV